MLLTFLLVYDFTQLYEFKSHTLIFIYFLLAFYASVDSLFAEHKFSVLLNAKRSTVNRWRNLLCLHYSIYNSDSLSHVYRCDEVLDSQQTSMNVETEGLT